jgi:hypothetical protein
MTADAPVTALDDLLRQIDDPSDIPWNEETYDVSRASELAGADRATYIARLIENARRGDARAILSLGHLNANEALPLLQADAKSRQPWAQVARRALVAMGHGREVLDATVDDALRGAAKMGRVAAVLDLARIGGAVAIDALLAALGDPDDTVRMLACDGIVALFDLKRHFVDPDGVPQMMTDFEIDAALLASDLRAFVELGARHVRDVVERLRGGAPPKSLGIAYAPFPAPSMLQQLRLALFDASATFPVDEIAQLSGPHRRLCEMIIGNRLGESDVRAPAALVRLGAAWTAPAMDEVAAGSAPAEYRDACTRCARTLRGS